MDPITNSNSLFVSSPLLMQQNSEAIQTQHYTENNLSNSSSTLDKASDVRPKKRLRKWKTEDKLWASFPLHTQTSVDFGTPLIQQTGCSYEEALEIFELHLHKNLSQCFEVKEETMQTELWLHQLTLNGKRNLSACFDKEMLSDLNWTALDQTEKLPKLRLIHPSNRKINIARLVSCANAQIASQHSFFDWWNLSCGLSPPPEEIKIQKQMCKMAETNHLMQLWFYTSFAERLGLIQRSKKNMNFKIFTKRSTTIHNPTINVFKSSQTENRLHSNLLFHEGNSATDSIQPELGSGSNSSSAWDILKAKRKVKIRPKPATDTVHEFKVDTAVGKIRQQKEEVFRNEIKMRCSQLFKAAQFFGTGPTFSNPDAQEIDRKMVYISHNSLPAKERSRAYHNQKPGSAQKLAPGSRRIIAEKYGLICLERDAFGNPCSVVIQPEPWNNDSYRDTWKQLEMAYGCAPWILERKKNEEVLKQNDVIKSALSPKPSDSLPLKQVMEKKNFFTEPLNISGKVSKTSILKSSSTNLSTATTSSPHADTESNCLISFSNDAATLKKNSNFEKNLSNKQHTTAAMIITSQPETSDPMLSKILSQNETTSRQCDLNHNEQSMIEVSTVEKDIEIGKQNFQAENNQPAVNYDSPSAGNVEEKSLKENTCNIVYTKDKENNSNVSKPVIFESQKDPKQLRLTDLFKFCLKQKSNKPEKTQLPPALADDIVSIPIRRGHHRRVLDEDDELEIPSCETENVSETEVASVATSELHIHSEPVINTESQTVDDLKREDTDEIKEDAIDKKSFLKKERNIIIKRKMREFIQQQGWFDKEAEESEDEEFQELKRRLVSEDESEDSENDSQLDDIEDLIETNPVYDDEMAQQQLQIKLRQEIEKRDEMLYQNLFKRRQNSKGNLEPLTEKEKEAMRRKKEEKQRKMQRKKLGFDDLTLEMFLSSDDSSDEISERSESEDNEAMQESYDGFQMKKATLDKTSTSSNELHDLQVHCAFQARLQQARDQRNQNMSNQNVSNQDALTQLKHLKRAHHVASLSDSDSETSACPNRPNPLFQAHLKTLQRTEMISAAIPLNFEGLDDSSHSKNGILSGSSKFSGFRDIRSNIDRSRMESSKSGTSSKLGFLSRSLEKL